MGGARKRPLGPGSVGDDQKYISNRKKSKRHKDLAAALYTASGHDEEFIIVQRWKTTSTRRLTGLASCSSYPNQLYASQSQWPLDVERLPEQQHDMLWTSSSFNSESFLSFRFQMKNCSDQHPLHQGTKDSQASYPSISIVLAQRNYRSFGSTDEFGISSLQANDVIKSEDEMGIAMRILLIKEAHSYDYSSHDDSLFPTFPNRRLNYSGISMAPPPPTHLQTHVEDQARQQEKRRGRDSIQLQCCAACDQIEIQPKHCRNGYQNSNINSSPCNMQFISYPSYCSNGKLSRINVHDFYISILMVANYPINMNHQIYETAYVGGGFQEMIKEYAEEAEYESKNTKNEIAEICASIFDFNQTDQLLDEIILESCMNSTSDESCCLEELIEIDDIIIDSQVHPTSTAYENNIETRNCDHSDDLNKYLNDAEMLILQEGKGSQQMIVEAEKDDDIETFISSIFLDGHQSLPGDNFQSYGNESTQMIGM